MADVGHYRQVNNRKIGVYEYLLYNHARKIKQTLYVILWIEKIVSFIIKSAEII